jgi:hypothetical protein
MGYKFLGFVVWKGLNLFLKSKYGSARTPKPLLAAGIVLAALGGAAAARQLASSDDE